MIHLHIIGTEAVLKILVPVCPGSCDIFPHPLMFPHLPVMSIGTVGRQIGRMWVLKMRK